MGLADNTCEPVIPPWRLRLEDHKFKANLSFRVNSVLIWTGNMTQLVVKHFPSMRVHPKYQDEREGRHM